VNRTLFNKFFVVLLFISVSYCSELVPLLARHDLVFTGTWSMRINWKITPDQPYNGLSTVLMNQQGGESLGEARQRCAELRKLNPNLKLLCEVRYREGRYVTDKNVELWKRGAYPPDSEFWLRDENGRLCPGWGEDADGDGEVELDEIRHMKGSGLKGEQSVRWHNAGLVE
jgi:hypothetical protein